jgi:hypothetical protein
MNHDIDVACMLREEKEGADVGIFFLLWRIGMRAFTAADLALQPVQPLFPALRRREPTQYCYFTAE